MEKSKQMEELINNLGDKLWTFCIRLTYDKLEAEDLYQDTILKALELKDKIDFDKNPAAFIYSLAVSINNNRFRKIFRRRGIAPIIHFDLDFIKDSKTDVEYEALGDERRSDIDIALNSLNKNQKAIILMFYMESMSIKDISKYLNIPEETVKSNLSIGRKKLKKELEGKGYGE